MKYRIDQLQVSGSHGCVSATVLSRDLFDNGEAFDPKARIEPS